MRWTRRRQARNSEPDEWRWCVRRSRVVLTQIPASSLREEAQATVSNKPGHRGEREVSRKTIAQGKLAIPVNLW
jgi:hypothetical protein